MISCKVKFKKVEGLKTETKMVFATAEEIDEIEIAQHEGKLGFLAFSPDELNTRVLEIMKDRKFATEPGAATPSQRLRGAIYKLWADKYSSKYSEEDFYMGWMTHFIEEIEKKHENN